MSARTLQVAILAFDDVEALDLAGPYEVFTTAARMHQRSAAGTAPPFEVQCVARTRAPVRMRAAPGRPKQARSRLAGRRAAPRVHQ